jgi:hypothetical protein
MRLQDEELASVVKLSRLILMMVVGLATVVVFGIGAAETMAMEPAPKGVLVCAIVLASINLLSSTLMFLSRGGASAHFSFISALLLLLYIYVLIGLYSASSLIYMALFKSAGSGALFKFFTSMYLLGTVSVLICTLQLPPSQDFLRDFRNNHRSNKVYLPRFISPHISPIDLKIHA